MDLFPKDSIQGCIALVTGGSRGIGKGVALMLGKAGATVYISGRTLHADSSCKGSLMDTASEIRSIGGHCIPVQCDHNNDEEVRRLFDRIKMEQDGRLDILVNSAFGGMEVIYIQMFTGRLQQDHIVERYVGFYEELNESRKPPPAVDAVSIESAAAKLLPTVLVSNVKATIKRLNCI